MRQCISGMGAEFSAAKQAAVVSVAAAKSNAIDMTITAG
jgi:hypothetical protein